MTAAAWPWLALVLRLGLAGVLGVAGALKLPDPDANVRAVRAYELLPEPVVPVVGYGLPVLEVALAVMLLLGVATRVAAVLTGLLLVVFLAGVISAWARGLTIDCGCFGGGGQVSASEARYHLDVARNLVFLAAAGLLAWRPTSPASLDARLFALPSDSTDIRDEQGVSR